MTFAINAIWFMVILLLFYIACRYVFPNVFIKLFTKRREKMKNYNVPHTFFEIVRYGLKEYGFLGSLSRYIMLKDEIKKFIREGETIEDRGFRKELVSRFNNIHKNVICAHSPLQFMLIAKYLLSHKVEGAMVQCGCYAGGSTAKLSLLAKKTNRKLYVFDSFQGLPEPKIPNEEELKGTNLPDALFSKGDYSTSLEQVKQNVADYGCIEVCEFIPGFFDKTLPNFKLKEELAFVFTDADYISSARTCLKYLWKHLKPNGYWFTHEAPFIKYVKGIMDSDWWEKNLNECPPVIIGGGTGLSVLAHGITYFQKPKK